VIGEFCFDGSMDIAVNVVRSDPFENSFGSDGREDVRLYSGEAQRDVLRLGESVDLCQFGGALCVYEVDAFEVRDERVRGRVVFRDSADAIIEGFGGGEKEAAVEA
jgi:hypothetical protein